jgi:hypothetical protein
VDRLRITNRPPIAELASVKRGSSLLITWIRVGSLPVYCSRYLRLTVIVSSPEIDSSRSTTTPPPRPAKRASETVASDLFSSGASPKSADRLLSVGAAQFLRPSSRSKVRAITPLPARVGPTNSSILWWSRRPEIR